MEQHTKQRLTGAAIVVALLVLLVPEMFRGRPAATPPASGGGTSGPPLRSYTIELRDSARSAPKAGATPAPVTSQQPALASPPPAIAAPVAEGRSAADADVVAPARTDAAAGGAASPAAAAPPAGGARSEPAAAPTSPAGAASDRYQVQLGLFASRANADRLAARVRGQGVRVAVSGPDARGLFRVHTPSFVSREEAQALQQKLRDLGLNAALAPQH